MASLHKRGRKWYAIYWEGGRQRWKAISTNKRLAEDFLKDLEAKRVRGELMGIREVKSIRFDAFCKKYLADYGPNKAESTRLRDDVTVNKHLAPFFGNRLLRQIAAADIEEYKAQRRATQMKSGKQIARSTVNRELDLLKSLLARAVEWGYLKANPAGEIQKFRMVHDVLDRHPRHIKGSYVFHNADGSCWHDVRRAFWNALDRAGLTHIPIHSLRHTFVSNLVASGVDLRAVQELAGHRDIKTTMRYAHLTPERLKNSVERLQWKAKGEQAQTPSA